VGGGEGLTMTELLGEPNGATGARGHRRFGLEVTSTDVCVVARNDGNMGVMVVDEVPVL